MKFFTNVFFEIKAANVGETETLELGFHIQYIIKDWFHIFWELKIFPTKAQAYASHFFHDDIIGPNEIDGISFSTTPRQYARDGNVEDFSSELESRYLACGDKVRWTS